MTFFRSAAPKESNDWAMDLLNSGVLPRYSSGHYVGIGALKNSDVLTAVSIVAGDVARFPIIEINDSDDSIVDGGNVSYLINKKSNATTDAYHWKFAMIANAILTGNSYSRIIRDPITGEPIDIVFYKPSETRHYSVNLSNGDVIYRYDFNRETGGSGITCEAGDVIHLKFFSTDTVVGRSPLLSLGDEMSLQASGTETLKSSFKSGFKSSILKAKGRLDKDARKKIRQGFEEAQEGSTSTIVVDDTMEYNQLEVDTNVLNLIQSNNWSTNQIAKSLRIPAFKLGVSSPNQSTKQLQADYIKNDLPFYFAPTTSEFMMKLMSDEDRLSKSYEFDTRKETGRSVEELKQASDAGFITPNEGRIAMGKKKDDTEPLMDQYQSSLNTVSLQEKAKYQLAKLKGGGKNGKGSSNDFD